MNATERFKTLTGSDAFQEGFQSGWHDATAKRVQKDRAELDRLAYQTGLADDELEDNAIGYVDGYAERHAQ